MTIIDHVAVTLRQRIRLAPGARVLVAISGGADSVALARLLVALQAKGMLVVAGLGHLNHQLRGDDADADEAFCGALAQRLGVAFRSTRVDVAALAAARRESLEAAARRARYAWLGDMARELNATHVATGHTLDDQAETVLLRLLRGAGTRGLSGIRAVRGAIIRPLIDCRRQRLREYLSAEAQPYREDASNLDLSIPRNRVRHELLPIIERFGTGAVAALARTAQLAADDESFLSRAATEAVQSLVLFSEASAQLPCERVRALPASVARRVIRQSIEQISSSDGGRLTSRHIESVLRAMAGADTRHVDLPGVTVDVSAGVLRLSPVGLSRAGQQAPVAFEYTLPVPGAITVLEAGWTISAERRDQSPVAGVQSSREGLSIAVPWRLVGGGCRVRNRWPGDRIKPIGALGRKKLQDLMVDLKVPRAARGRVPVVVDAAGRVVWVVGVAMADEFRVTVPEAEVVVFTAKRQ